MARKGIIAPNGVSVGPYSHGVDADGFIFVSGQAYMDAKTGKLVEGDIQAQTEQTFKNLFGVLEAAGLSSDNVQKVNVYLTDINDFKAMNEVYEKQFTKPYPARTTIGVASLPMGVRVEIECIARR